MRESSAGWDVGRRSRVGRLSRVGRPSGTGRRSGTRMLGGKWAVGLATGLVAGLVGGLAGCGATAAPVRLPVRGPHATATSAAPAHESARELVIGAYRGYWRATNNALDSRNPQRATEILAGYVPRTAVAALVNGLRRLWRRDEISYGEPVLHIMGVTFTGSRTAAVHDCIDMSHAGFQDWQTGQVVGGLGQPHDNLITTLALEHGRWLVTDAITVARPCAY